MGHTPVAAPSARARAAVPCLSSPSQRLQTFSCLRQSACASIAMPAAKVPCVVVLGKLEEKPVVRNGEIVIRTILPLTGTFDHRIVDGMQIGKLARSIKRSFRKPEWLDEVPEKELGDCIFEMR